MRNRMIVVAVFTLAVACGIAFIRYVPPVYTGTARLYVETASPKLLEKANEANKAKNYLYTQATILKSKSILEDVIRSTGDDACPQTLKTIAEKENPLFYLSESLDTAVGKKDDIIMVSFASHDPAECADVTNAVVRAYIAYNEGKYKNTSGQLLEILQKEKAQYSTELMEKLGRLTDFKNENKDVVFGSKKGDILNERLDRFSDALTEAQLETLQADAVCQAVQSVASDPVQLRSYLEAQRMDAAAAGIDESTILRNKINNLQLQFDKLLRVLTPEHPSVKAMEDKIAATFDQLQEIEKEYARSQVMMARQQLEIAQEKQKQVQERYDQQRQLVLDINQKYSEYLLLESDWEQTKKMCDVIDERIREIDISEDSGALNIHVLETARVPEFAAWPDPKRVMVLSGLIGLVFACGIALIRDFFDRRFCSEKEILQVLGSPVLGVIVKTPRHDPAELISYSKPDSSVAQMYRKLCTSVLYRCGKEDQRILHVYSGRSGEGKTAAAVNLATAMAHSGQRTLLLDANFVSPRLREIFGIHPRFGLAELVRRECVLPDVVCPTYIDGLDFLDCGNSILNPIQLINSERFRSVLRILRCRYDRILIDSESLNRFPESLILSHLADGVLWIMDGEHSDQRRSMNMLKELKTIGADVVGVVVSGVREKNSCFQHQQKWQEKSNSQSMINHASFNMERNQTSDEMEYEVISYD